MPLTTDNYCYGDIAPYPKNGDTIHGILSRFAANLNLNCQNYSESMRRSIRTRFEKILRGALPPDQIVYHCENSEEQAFFYLYQPSKEEIRSHRDFPGLAIAVAKYDASDKTIHNHEKGALNKRRQRARNQSAQLFLTQGVILECG